MGSGTPANGGRSSAPTAILSPSLLASPRGLLVVPPDHRVEGGIAFVDALQAGIQDLERAHIHGPDGRGDFEGGCVFVHAARVVPVGRRPRGVLRVRAVDPAPGGGYHPLAAGARTVGAGAGAVDLGILGPKGGTCSSSTKSTRWWERARPASRTPTGTAGCRCWPRAPTPGSCGTSTTRTAAGRPIGS